MEKILVKQPLIEKFPVIEDYPISHILFLDDIKWKETRYNNLYLQCSLSDSSGKIPFCKKWEVSTEEAMRIKNNQIVFITGKTKLYEDQLYIEIKSIGYPELIDPALYEDILSESQIMTKELQNDKALLWKSIKKTGSPEIFSIYQELVSRENIKNALNNHEVVKNLLEVYSSPGSDSSRLLIFIEKVYSCIDVSVFVELIRIFDKVTEDEKLKSVLHQSIFSKVSST